MEDTIYIITSILILSSLGLAYLFWKEAQKLKRIIHNTEKMLEVCESQLAKSRDNVQQLITFYVDKLLEDYKKC